MRMTSTIRSSVPSAPIRSSQATQQEGAVDDLKEEGEKEEKASKEEGSWSRRPRRPSATAPRRGGTSRLTRPMWSLSTRTTPPSRCAAHGRWGRLTLRGQAILRSTSDPMVQKIAQAMTGGAADFIALPPSLLAEGVMPKDPVAFTETAQLLPIGRPGEAMGRVAPSLPQFES